MAYENVKGTSLKNSLTTLKDIENNKNKLVALKESIDSDKWSGNTRKRIKEAIGETITYYNILIKYMNNCIKACDYIDEYKELDKQNDNYKIKSRNARITINTSPSLADTSSIEQDMNAYNDKIYQNNNKKRELKNKINELIDF